jgi:hypothetical protein
MYTRLPNSFDLLHYIRIINAITCSQLHRQARLLLLELAPASNPHVMPQFPSISVPQLYSSLLTAARSIPRDPLRPSLQLPETLETLVQRAFKRPTPTVGASNAESSAIKELSQEEVTKLGFGIGDLTRLDRSLKAMQEINQDTAFRKVGPGTKQLPP